jgi:carbohydrate kinase (thermoresistant glucokinase family)
MIIVVMGVSGSGKTTIGTLLADALQCSFLEGDSLHSKENIEKMSHGVPLNDSDRAPWLSGHSRSNPGVFQARRKSCRGMLRSEAAVSGISS